MMNQFSSTVTNGLPFMTVTPPPSSRVLMAQKESDSVEPERAEVPYTSIHDVAIALIWILALCGGWVLLRNSWQRCKSSMSASQGPDDELPWSKRPSFEALYAGLPCTSCRYFKSNRYLSCAVHPTRVLTADARDCPDFHPKS